MEPSLVVCHWKELWRLTSAFSNTTSSSLVTKKLNDAKTQLADGLSYFKQSSSESFTKLSSRHAKYPKALTFIEKLQTYMNLDSAQTWNIFCHFLSNQFHGIAENALLSFSFVDVRIDQLLFDVWTFYNSERFYMLKLLKLIIECGSNSNHVYTKEFESVIKSIGLDKLKTSLINQFEVLVKEVPPSKIHNGEMITQQMQNKWLERNLREQSEILSILIVDENQFSMQEFKKLFSLFKTHNFGRQPTYSKCLDETHQNAITKIVYAEVALFYKIVNDAKSKNIRTIIDSIKDEVESELIRLQHNPEHGALLLAWMLLLLQDSEGEELFQSRYQHFGTKALQLHVFEFLYRMVTHPMFSDDAKCAKIFRNSVYQMLTVMCDKFDRDGSVALHTHAVELCNELLSDPSIAESFWGLLNESESPGIVSIWNTGLEFFPYDFKTISTFIVGLSKAGPKSRQCLAKELEILPVYTELYKPGLISVTNVMDDEDTVILTEDYFPHGDKALAINARSQATIMDRRNATLIHFRTSVSYWRVLQNEIQDLLDESLHGRDVLKISEKVLYGVKALVSVLNHLDPGECLPEPLVGPCEAVFEILVRFGHSKTPLLPLIAACLDVSTALIPNYTQKVYIRLLNIRLLPRVEYPNLSHLEYAKGDSFQTSIFGLYLMNIEQPTGEYQILSSYLDLLFAFYDCNYDSDISLGVLLPGLIFILREVFPHMPGWYFKSQEAKRNMYFKCVSYLLKILQLSPEQTTRPADLLLNKTCVYSILNLDNGIALLKLISLGEPFIQSLMEQETNWTNGSTVEFLKTIQISMSILMQVLRLKSLVMEKSTLGTLERLIYTQPKQKDAMKIVPIVTGYMNHVFNQQLPNAACRLLRRFALEFQMSLLVCLDMSPHQIRTMFLERLRDETESVSLKTVILEFVAACVEKQPGLTEAFFKVSQDETRMFQRDKTNDKTDGILTYMAEYLAAVKNNTNSLYSPLLSRIMGLFHALWKNNMQMLVRDLRENPNFWEYLCSPLFQDILPDIKAYSQIFNMIGIELFLFEGKIDKSLQAALEKLFNGNGKYLKKWVEYIFSFDGRKISLDVVDEVPGWLSLLTSWKDFISIIMRHLPITINVTSKSIMVENCLETLNREMEAMNEGRTVVILAEMYVIFFSNWKEDCFEDRNKYLKQIASLLSHTAESFDSLHPRASSSVLAISTLSLNMLTYDLRSAQLLSYDIIHSICAINCSQLDKICTTGFSGEPCLKNDISISITNDIARDQSNLIILSLRLLEQCIYVFKDGFTSDVSHLFMSSRLINKLVYCSALCVQKKNQFRQSLAALNCLSAFARSSVSVELLHCDISQHLWLQLLPPREFCQTGSIKVLNSEDSLWKPNDWWQVYTCGIEFVTAMLLKHGNFFSNDAIIFVGVHEEYLTESVLLMRQSLDLEVLNLASATLYFVSELVKYEAKWRQDHFQSMVALMRSISVCFHYCITMVLRPKGILFSTERPSNLITQEDSDNVGPTPKVAVILNKLLELMHLSAVCLKAFSPDLLSLLADPNPDLSCWQPLMELQFGAPKLSQDPYPQLTFGTVMSAVCLLTRSLNCNYHPEETPLNVIRKQGGRRGSSRRRTSGGLGSDEGIRRRALRSDSVTSLSSTTSSVTIGPGWLAALDKRLVLLTLENILTLLASQALLATKDNSMSSRDKQLVRRELCTELPVFHDFVKKKVLDLSHPKNYLSRKKFGSYPLLNSEEENKSLFAVQAIRREEDDSEFGSDIYTPPAPPPRRSQDSMRVSVVRKLHLDKARTKSGDLSLSKSPEYSPVYPSLESDDPQNVSGSDSSLTKSPPGSSRTSKHVTWDEISFSPPEEIEYLDPEDPEHCPLTEVQIVEEDYFHFLSTVFLYFCETEH